MIQENEIDQLLDNLPLFIKRQLKYHSNKAQLIEIVLDLGRRPEARFINSTEYLNLKPICWQDLDYITKRISTFNYDNRTGIKQTLHRISCIRNRQFLINGLTCRIGRTVFGTLSVIRDLLELEQSILILGKPGVGKTTIIREIARILSEEMEKRVIIVDTSNEIAGDSDIPHTGIGNARRMQVPKTDFQYKVMVEAIENHMPQVIIIDEIGTELEARAAQTIAEKGIQLIGTTHGNCLENLIKNPALSVLIGDIQYVTLSDDEAKRRSTQKSILERKTYPTFQIAIEINNICSWTIHEDTKNSVDLLLRKDSTINQVRKFSKSKKFNIRYSKAQTNFSFIHSNSVKNNRLINCHNWVQINKVYDIQLQNLKVNKLVIYPYLLPSNLIKEIITKANFKIVLTKRINQANLIIGLKKYVNKNSKLKNLAKLKNIPVYTVNQTSVYQIIKLIYFFQNK